jgi:hypothetical protein
MSLYKIYEMGREEKIKIRYPVYPDHPVLIDILEISGRKYEDIQSAKDLL